MRYTLHGSNTNTLYSPSSLRPFISLFLQRCGFELLAGVTSPRCEDHIDGMARVTVVFLSSSNLLQPTCLHLYRSYMKGFSGRLVSDDRKTFLWRQHRPYTVSNRAHTNAVVRALHQNPTVTFSNVEDITPAKPTSLTYLNHILAFNFAHTRSPPRCDSPLLHHVNDPDHFDHQHTQNVHEQVHDHHYSTPHPRHRRLSHSPPLLEALRRQHGEAKPGRFAKKGRVPERIVQPCEIVGRDLKSGGHCAAGRVQERIEHGASPKTVVDGEGLHGDSRGVEGEGEEGMVVVGNESWARIGRYLREGLAEGVSWTDAVGREVRGDGSLVG